MTDEKKLYQAYCDPDRLWTGSKAMKELHKNTSMPKNVIKSWLTKQALWQVHIPPPKEIHHLLYDVMNNTSLIFFTCLIIFLKETSTSIS